MSMTLEALEQFVAGLAAEPERWEHLIRHADDARVYELIWEDEEVNAWVICWSVDQDTGFHDHDLSGAAVAVLSGEVVEERLRVDGPPSTRRLAAGARITIPPTAIHRVLHAGERPAVTVHAYSPPLTRTGSYRVTAGGELERLSMSAEEELRVAVHA